MRMPGKGVVAALTVGSAMLGFSKGMSNSGIGDSFYELATGNPNIDNDVFGTDVNPLSFINPLSSVHAAAYGSPGMRGNMSRLMAGVNAGLVNSRSITDMNRGVNNPLQNGLRYRNSPPRVDGSIVFGQYNSRFGG